MNVNFTPSQETYIRGLVAQGDYNNASEVVREALRMFRKREKAETAALSERLPVPPPPAETVLHILANEESALRERGIVGLALFGSVADGTARNGSDIDILIDVDPSHGFTLVDLVDVTDVLTARLGAPVDLVTRDGLDPLIKDRVEATATSVF